MRWIFGEEGIKMGIKKILKVIKDSILGFGVVLDIFFKSIWVVLTLYYLETYTSMDLFTIRIVAGMGIIYLTYLVIRNYEFNKNMEEKQNDKKH